MLSSSMPVSSKLPIFQFLRSSASAVHGFSLPCASVIEVGSPVSTMLCDWLDLSLVDGAAASAEGDVEVAFALVSESLLPIHTSNPNTATNAITTPRQSATAFYCRRLDLGRPVRRTAGEAQIAEKRRTVADHRKVDFDRKGSEGMSQCVPFNEESVRLEASYSASPSTKSSANPPPNKLYSRPFIVSATSSKSVVLADSEK